MYAIELAPEFAKQVLELHPKRFKQIHLRVFALQTNPRPPESVMLDPERYLVQAGPYVIAYRIDDAQQRICVLWLEERGDR